MAGAAPLTQFQVQSDATGSFKSVQIASNKRYTITIAVSPVPGATTPNLYTYQLHLKDSLLGITTHNDGGSPNADDPTATGFALNGINLGYDRMIQVSDKSTKKMSTNYVVLECDMHFNSN